MDLNSWLYQRPFALSHIHLNLCAAAQPPRLPVPWDLVIHQCHVHIVALKGMKKNSTGSTAEILSTE